jgi:rfaE bifunctional protein nucleotidyltransferase chain/domain
MIKEKIIFEDQSFPIDTITKIKRKGKKIVFTNGCFDIIHIGHVLYLEEAKSLGDYLIVGINTDFSVQNLKGNHRPINDLKCRSNVLAALESVDLVIPFSEETPLKLIEKILPDILVKGGDWKPETIVGSQIVINNGGQVKSLKFIEGYSTTAIEQKIKSEC